MACSDRARSRVLKTLARFGHEPSLVADAGGGANSRVFLAEMPGGGRLSAKAYLAPTAEGRSRLEAEFSALAFLAEHGEYQTPQPVAADAQAQVGLYEFVDGAQVETPDQGHLDQALRFLERLHALAALPQAALLEPASAAVLESGALSRNVSGRLAALATIVGDSSESYEVRVFASDELMPSLERFARDEPSPGAWTLSPSDFGFHNVLERPGGKLCFLDFEYFGRDDPAKLLCDLLLHPGNRMDEVQRLELARRILPVYRDDGLALRAARLYPLAALMWCAIILNPLLPGHHLHGPHIAANRLAAARTMLDKARNGVDPGELS